MTKGRFSGRKVLVTGAGGFIGSHLAERLVAEGAQVRALLRYTSRAERGCLDLVPIETLQGMEVVYGDVRDLEAVREVTRDAHVVFHLAALVGIPYSYVHPQEVIETNVLGTANVLIAARESERIDRVVLTSTSEVYGTARYVPMDEQHPLQAQSPYSASKIASDALGVSFHRSFETPVAIVRPFNCYGPRQSARAIISTVICQALRGDEVRIGSLTSTRDFTFVADTAEGFLRVAEAEGALGEPVNLGSGTEISVGGVIETVGRLLGRDLRAVVEERRLRPTASEVTRLYADNRRAREVAGWEPSVPFEEGLRRTIDWISDHPDLYEPEVYAV